MSAINPKNISTNVQDIKMTSLNDIQNLQNIEKDLLYSLENQDIQNPLSNETLNKIVNKINDISQLRMKLYNTINNLTSFYKTSLSDTQDTLNQQNLVIKIVEDELTQSKKRLSLIQKEKNNKMRIIQNNTFFGDKYSTHTNVIKSVLFFIVLLFILTILLKKNIIPQSVYIVLTSILVIYEIFNLFTQINSIILRDNMNYDEYNWGFNKSKAPVKADNGNNGYGGIKVTSNISDPWGKMDITCMGQSCCYTGSTYDSKQNQCIPN
jgi:hypothetical protein